MNIKIIRSDERGYYNHGWLKTHHSFSFSDYYNPECMNFGALRVLNDDIIEPGKGFGLHPHSNMEIVTIPLAGTVEHEDSTGEKGTIKPNEVQVMSAGTGIFHSERNGGNDLLSLLQIWIIPNIRNAKPRYDQRQFEHTLAIDNNQFLVSGDGRDRSLTIHQQAFLSRRIIKDISSFSYIFNAFNNGLFIFIIEGSARIDNEILHERDSISIIPDEQIINLKSDTGSNLLFIEVPIQ